jgi:hypothetical protein
VKRVVAVALAVAACAVAAPAASAAPGMEVALQDDPVFLQRDYYDRDRALAQARDMGVTRLRVNLGWARALSGDQDELRTAPSSPVYAFQAWDDLIDAAAPYGIRVQLTIIPPAPAYATGDKKVGEERPDPALFGRFVRAVAEHFRGRVGRYALWNEPNHIGWLTPQSTAAAQYRELYRQGYNAVKRADRSAEVLIGELVPYQSRRRSSSPLTFLRDLTCTRTTAGVPGFKNYKVNRRGNCPVLRADGLAHHPYDYQGPPERSYPGADNVTIGTLDRLTTTLAAMAKVRALATPKRKPLPVFITEFGYFGAGRYMHPDIRRASYLRRAFQIAQRNPSVQEMVQYLLVRPPRRYTGGYFDMSVVSTDGTPFPPYKAIQKWASASAARGGVAAPGPPIALPQRPAP